MPDKAASPVSFRIVPVGSEVIAGQMFRRLKCGRNGLRSVRQSQVSWRLAVLQCI